MKVVGALILMISCTVLANVLLKIGAMTRPGENLAFANIAWQSVAGILVFGCSLLIYAWVLRSLPLSLAQSFAALQFVGVIVASAVLLSENIPPLRWIGIALITVGILLVGITATSAAD